jgi:hypothetical protein
MPPLINLKNRYTLQRKKKNKREEEMALLFSLLTTNTIAKAEN